MNDEAKSPEVREFTQLVSEMMSVSHRLVVAHDRLTVAEDRRLKTQNIEDRLRTAALRISQVSSGVELR